MEGSPQTCVERAVQKQYWIEHSTNATVETMMLDSKAADIDKMERPEVLELLGSVEGKDVVELGAGIGRFTAPLASTAKSVVALDFMENLIEENRRANSHYGNIDFRCGDATELELPASSQDVVFSNWLLMYLNDGEVRRLAQRTLGWLRPGGCVFFRESCFRQSGDRARGSNPSHYRSPREYFAAFDCVREEADKGGAGAHQLELAFCKSIDTYVRVKQNQNQICWKWVKVPVPASQPAVDRRFLDDGQYSARGIARYEWIFGEGFMSPGGSATSERLASRLDAVLAGPEARVLDLGCGTGGAALHLARTRDCLVHGLDLSVNAVLTALDRAAAHGNGERVSFEVCDLARRALAPAAYDAALVRDALQHVPEEGVAEMAARVREALRPGGELLLTAYCAPEEGQLCEAMHSHARRRGYSLLPVSTYGRLLREAGLEVLEQSDISPLLAGCLRQEIERLRQGRDRFLQEFSKQEHEATLASWEGKLARVLEGKQCWGLLHARRPL